MIIGIVGKANVGKSTFFKALTLADILIGNYPFATIKPNRGTGYVRIMCACKDFSVQCTPRFGSCVQGTRYIPVEVLDVAGLVPGAHEGKGMGNQFLDDLRQADALLHVVDISGSTNEKGEPVEPGSYDPLNDIRFLEVELDMWYYHILRKGWEKFARTIQQTHAKISEQLAKQLSGLNVKEGMIEQGITNIGLDPTKPSQWTDEQLQALAKLLRKRTKPMVIVANKADMSSGEANIQRAREAFPDYLIVATSAESELALREAAERELVSYNPGDSDFTITGNVNDKQQQALEFIKEKVIKRIGNTGVQQALEAAVFDLLHMIVVFPGGVNNLKDSQGRILPDSFLMSPTSTVIDFAGKIHTDLVKNFIGAMDVRTKRKIGRDHELKHRDVIEILTRN